MVFLLGFAIVWFPQSAMSANDILVSSVAQEYKDGSDMDIIKAIARKLNARLEIKYSPFKRRLSMMEDGVIDFIPGLLKNSEREKYIHFIYPPYKSRSDTVFFVPRGKTALIRSYKDLYSLRIGIITGSKYFPEFDGDTRLNVEAYSSAESNFKKLMAGRIDTAVFPESVGIDLIHRMHINEKVDAADYRFSEQKNVYIGISKKSWLMNAIQKVEHAMRSMIESGELRQVIVDHYTSRGLPVPAL